MKKAFSRSGEGYGKSIVNATANCVRPDFAQTIVSQSAVTANVRTEPLWFLDSSEVSYVLYDIIPGNIEQRKTLSTWGFLVAKP